MAPTNGFAGIQPEKMVPIVLVLPLVPEIVCLSLLTDRRKSVGRTKPMPAIISKRKLYPASVWSLPLWAAENGLNLTKETTERTFISTLPALSGLGQQRHKLY